jgi:hypothetical protein
MESGALDVAWFIVYTGQGDLNEEGYKKQQTTPKLNSMLFTVW